MKKLILMALISGLLSVEGLLSAQEVSLPALINEMVDLEALARPADPAYTTIQYSSYDRRSVYPGYQGWFSNSDGFGGEPTPGFLEILSKPDRDGVGEYLICDVKGPGVIVRLWTAWIEGEISLWLDGARTPIYQGPAQNFFQHTYEALLGMENKPEWMTTLAQNTAAYYPIPFAKGCRMVWKGKLNTLHFYHVQVRQYDRNAKVQTLTLEQIRAQIPRLDEVASVLGNPSKKLDQPLSQADNKVVWLKPGEKKTAYVHRGSAALSHLAVSITAGDLDKALRQTIIEARFDGSPWGQVYSPVGDFFGAGPGINPYESLPFTVHHDGTMVCRYHMPFRDSVELIFRNMGDQELTISTRVLTVSHRWENGKSMHFRARWRIDHDLLADPSQVKDVPYLMIRGSGKMVGAAAFIANPTYVPSSYGNWWGEGDEKIFIDDRLEASFIGTGSEDYFNYAWSSAELFAHAYCGQPRNDGPANRGFVANYRWHILDNIPFSKSFDFYMELYSHRVVHDFSYGRMIYLYAIPESHDDHFTITKKDVEIPVMPAAWWPEADGWALNAIFYQAEDLIASHYPIEKISSYLWSDSDLMLWHPKAMGDRLDFDLPVSDSGTYMIALTVARRAVAGQIRVYLDDKILVLDGNEVHDLRTPYRDVSRNLKSGDVTLTEGLHSLSIELAGEKVAPVGIDFIWVKKK